MPKTIGEEEMKILAITDNRNVLVELSYSEWEVLEWLAQTVEDKGLDELNYRMNDFPEYSTRSERDLTTVFKIIWRFLKTKAAYNDLKAMVNKMDVLFNQPDKEELKADISNHYR